MARLAYPRTSGVLCVASRASLTMLCSAFSFSWASFFLASSLRLLPHAKDSSNDPLYHLQVEDHTSTCSFSGSALVVSVVRSGGSKAAAEQSNN